MDGKIWECEKVTFPGEKRDLPQSLDFAVGSRHSMSKKDESTIIKDGETIFPDSAAESVIRSDPDVLSRHGIGSPPVFPDSAAAADRIRKIRKCGPDRAGAELPGSPDK